MPSQEFKEVVELIKSAPDKSHLSYTERRAAERKDAALLPLAKDVTVEPFSIGETPAAWFNPPEMQPEKVLLYLHGGGYCLGSISTHQSMISHLAQETKIRCLAIDYRLAPEHPFPAAVQDASAVYEWLISDVTSPRRIVIAGDSAGGGLTMATLLDLKTREVPLPAAAVCLSPWCDLESKGESYQTNIEVDPIVDVEQVSLFAKAYLGKSNPKSPLASPLFGNLTGLPPLLVQVGSAEVLLDDAKRLVANATMSAVDAVLEVWDEMIHVWQYHAYKMPEAREALEKIARFIDRRVE